MYPELDCNHDELPAQLDRWRCLLLHRQSGRSHLLTEHIDALRAALRYLRSRHPFILDAIVVLPDHLHAIWTLPPEDADYSTRWRLIKTEFARGVEPGEQRSRSRATKSERGIWQRRFWEHTLRDERDFERHCDYIHFNPVKHGQVREVRQWPYSSFAEFVRLGIYPVDWAGVSDDHEGDFGERE